MPINTAKETELKRIGRTVLLNLNCDEMSLEYFTDRPRESLPRPKPLVCNRRQIWTTKLLNRCTQPNLPTQPTPKGAFPAPLTRSQANSIGSFGGALRLRCRQVDPHLRHLGLAGPSRLRLPAPGNPISPGVRTPASWDGPASTTSTPIRNASLRPWPCLICSTRHQPSGQATSAGTALQLQAFLARCAKGQTPETTPTLVPLALPAS